MIHKLSISDTVLMAWQTGRKTHKSSSGWISGNAVCCEHNGESRDTRGRGGVILNGQDISISCFNCKFKASYKAGFPLSIKFLKFLSWLGFDDKEIGRLRLIGLQNNSDVNDNTLAIQLFETCDLPDDSRLLSSVVNEFPNHVNYIKSRGFSLDEYPFHVSTSFINQMKNRIILPFYRYNKVVGYTSRAINDVMPKYYTRLVSPYVFGIDLQKSTWSWTIATEGPFDALSVNGLGFLGNEISEVQVDIVKRLNMKIVVVADNDAAGGHLIEDAMECGWPVSFPEWPDHIKDLNMAVQEYGKLFVLRHVWSTTITNSVQIQIRQKLNKKKLKKNKKY